jgi:hypothetical protein
MRSLYFPSCYLQNLDRKICIRRKIDREKILIFLQNFKCSNTTGKDLVISAKINVIFYVIFMFEVSRLPATC